MLRPEPYPNDGVPVQSPLNGWGKERTSRQAIEDPTRTAVRDGMASLSDLEVGGAVTSEILRTVDGQSQFNTSDQEAELASIIIGALKMFRRRDDENVAAPPA